MRPTINPMSRPIDGPDEEDEDDGSLLLCVAAASARLGAGVTPHGSRSARVPPAAARSPPLAKFPRTVITSGTESSHVTTVKERFS